MDRKERYLVWGAMLAGFMLIVAVWLNNLAGYGNGNDPNYALSTGYAIDPADPFLHKLHDAAVANCPPTDVWCTGYQQLILSDLYFNYPIYGLFGRLLALNPAEPFSAAATTATLGAVALGFVVAAILFGLVAHALPARSRFTLAAIFIVGAPVAVLAREFPFGQLDIGTSITWPRLAMCIGGLAAAFAASRLPALQALAGGPLDRLVRMPTARMLALAAVGIVALIGCRLAFPASFVVWLAGVAVFFALMAICCVLAGTGFVKGASIVFVMFLIVNPHDFLWPAFYVVPRGNIYLLASALLAYAVLYPNGRLVWLLPIFALNHVSVCSIVAAALFAMEVCIFPWRRRVTLLLVVSAAVVIFGRLFTALSFHGWAASIDVWTVARVVVESDRLVPGMIFASILGTAGLLLLRQRDERWDPAARVVLLMALLAAGAQIAPILDLAKFTLSDDGLAVILLASHYLAPALAIAGVVVLVTCLLDTAEPRAGGGAASPLAVLACSAVAALEVVRVMGAGFSPSEWAGRIATSVAELAAAQGAPSNDPLFHRLRADDDVYFLRSNLNPKNDPIIYLSLLKYKVRAAAGVFDAQRAVIETIDGSRPENVTLSAP